MCELFLQLFKYNQTTGINLSLFALHKTWFVCTEPEEPCHKFLRRMPPAAVGSCSLLGQLVCTKTECVNGKYLV